MLAAGSLASASPRRSGASQAAEAGPSPVRRWLWREPERGAATSATRRDVRRQPALRVVVIYHVVSKTAATVPSRRVFSHFQVDFAAARHWEGSGVGVGAGGPGGERLAFVWQA